MRADFQKVDRLSVKVLETVRRPNKSGENVRGDRRWRFESELPGVKTSGIISPGNVGELPGASVHYAGEVNGTFVIDGVVGDYLCAKFGDLKANPLTHTE